MESPFLKVLKMHLADVQSDLDKIQVLLYTGVWTRQPPSVSDRVCDMVHASWQKG